jgi:hypothetical protein
MLPSKPQQYAIQAKLNFILGAEVYDRLFLGFACGPIFNDTVSVFIQDKDRAKAIAEGYSWHVATAVESVLRLPISYVNVLTQDVWKSQQFR